MTKYKIQLVVTRVVEYDVVAVDEEMARAMAEALAADEKTDRFIILKP